MSVTDTKFEAGPWFVDGDFIMATGKHGGKFEIACISGSRADADLMATSPEMYAALHQAATVIENMRVQFSISRTCQEARQSADVAPIYALLAKARGEAR